MVITNYGKNEVSLILGGSSTIIPEYFIIGSGSGISVITQTELIASVDRQLFTNTTVSPQNVLWQGDWNSIEMSGIQLTEFAVIASGTGLTGSIWSRASLPTLTFNGTRELRIEESWEVF